RAVRAHVVWSVRGHAERVGAVTVPVPHEHDVVLASVVEHDVGVAAEDAVLHVVGEPAAHGEGVDAVTVPVAHQHPVPGPPVDDGQVGGPAGHRVLHVV